MNPFNRKNMTESVNCINAEKNTSQQQIENDKTKELE
jgi:hypothetical protein